MHTESFSAENIAAIRRQSWGRLFGGGIEEARRTAGLSIDQAAEAAGMEASEWRAIEAGHVPGDWERLRAMADAMDVPHDQMALYAFMCQGVHLNGCHLAVGGDQQDTVESKGFR
jgi:transcriptional regulator with XRE-family HTH domain